MTTTTAPPTAEQATAEHDALLDRLAAGQPVDPLDLVRAETDVRLAEVADEHRQRRAVEEAERVRLAGIDTVRARVAVEIPAHVDRLAARYKTARKALIELWAAADELTTLSVTASSELKRLAPYPDDANVQGRGVTAVVHSIAGTRLHTIRNTNLLVETVTIDAARTSRHRQPIGPSSFVALIRRTAGLED